ncbi:hypothetical protein BGZ99_006362 [Dissophora globulifera]|uniref:Methyltransferase type 12 domain-containing protein n=1 Tax=Dissophora globulifera TaxID=979702 RepID=A0A9P6USH1_9FUNG|nr:hypothetical protein BGZ99_006362 [Dissophora globulifera]
MADIQKINNDHFNKTAQDYDSIPQAYELAESASKVVVEEFTTSTSEEHVKDSTVLEFGCGTGLCAFQIAPKVAHVLGVDASEGMLNHLNYKLATNVENSSFRDKVSTALHLVADNQPLPAEESAKYLAGANGGFDLVYSNFVMHHIEDIQGIVNTLAARLLKRNGWLIVIDFMGENHHHHHHHHHGHSHAEGDKKVESLHDHFVDAKGIPLAYVAHKGGFTPEIFVEIFKKAGLVDIEAKRSFGLDREVNGKKVYTQAVVAKGRRV